MRGLAWLLAGCVTLGGCAARRVVAPSPPIDAMATTRPTEESRLRLDQILPKPTFDTPTTRPAGKAPLAALNLYAQAVSAQLSGDRRKEISLLRQALALDPEIFSLNYALGLALAGSGNGNEAAIEQLERGAKIRPDHLDVQFQLGRQYLARNNLPRALQHLRLAIATTEYNSRADGAALADWYLARALQQKGYDQAAIDQYESLLSRLAARLNFRNKAELWYLHAHPEGIYQAVGKLHEKLEQYQDALECYGSAMQHAPDNFGIQADLTRLLVRMKRFNDARELAIDMVKDQHGSTESVRLLKEILQAMGREAAVVDEVKALLAKNPDDRRLMFGVADAMTEVGRAAEAEKLLAGAVNDTRADILVVWKLFEFYQARQETRAAAKLLVSALAQRPESLGDLLVLWSRLAGQGGKSRLKAADLAALEVPAGETGSKLYWVARMAMLSNRIASARATLEQAAGLSPIFEPAYRDLLTLYLGRTDWTDQQKMQAAWKLIDRAGDSGRKALAAEMQGLVLLAQNKPWEAAEAFGKAILNGDRSATVRFMQATALIGAGRSSEGEAMLWQVLAQWPGYGGAYQALYQHYQGTGDARQAERALQMWLQADPFSIAARLLQTAAWQGRGRSKEAEGVVLGVLRDAPDNAMVLAQVCQFFRGRDEELLEKLEEERARRPANLLLVSEMAGRYHAARRASEATAVLDQMRAAVKDDAEQLYALADLYQQIGQRQVCEDVLRQALALDPRNAGANNYLGYLWVEDGKKLAEAEGMIRTALAAEPENGAFLDSLGWALYKRGKFDEAKQRLEEAAGALATADPVVLDHLGDALYRLGKAAEAARVWGQSMDRLPEEAGTLRGEYAKLKLQLKRKLEQHKAGGKVEVAPVAEVGD